MDPTWDEEAYFYADLAEGAFDGLAAPDECSYVGLEIEVGDDEPT